MKRAIQYGRWASRAARLAPGILFPGILFPGILLPGLLLPGLLLSALGLGACSETEAPGPRGVLLISLDTLRADACSLYGYERPTTPFLEELGARGIVFEKHVANSNNTLVSHATMLTGLFPEAHGVYDAGEHNRALAPSAETLAERLAADGFATGMFTTHPAWLGRSFGLAQGFETVESDWIDARQNSQRFLSWLDDEQPERFFAFLHYYDAHSERSGGPQVLPYEAPPEYLERFAPPRPADFTGEVVNRAGETVSTSRYLEHYASPFRDLPDGHLEFLRGAYDAGVAKLDADLRLLFEALEERGLADQLLIVVTSDHGEEFKEHRRMLHMEYHDEIMRVPLLVVPPRAALETYRAAGSRPRVAELSRSVDLAPTVLELCGLEPGFSQGSSFASAVSAGSAIPWRDSLFGESILRGRDQGSEYKICDVENYYTFYDLDEDPAELASLVDRKLEWNRVEPARWESIRQRVAQTRAANRAILDRLTAAGEVRAEVDDAGRDALRELGYFGNDEAQADGTPRKEPATPVDETGG